MASKDGQFITKSHKNKDGKEVKVIYRVDAAFVPEKIGDICEEFIQNYVIANDKTDWLVAQYSEKETATAKKDTKSRKKGDTYEQDKSFVSIRSAFVDEFFPTIKKGTGKDSSARTDFLKKYGKK